MAQGISASRTGAVSCAQRASHQPGPQAALLPAAARPPRHTQPETRSPEKMTRSGFSADSTARWNCTIRRAGKGMHEAASSMRGARTSVSQVTLPQAVCTKTQAGTTASSKGGPGMRGGLGVPLGTGCCTGQAEHAAQTRGMGHARSSPAWAHRIALRILRLALPVVQVGHREDAKGAVAAKAEPPIASEAAAAAGAAARQACHIVAPHAAYAGHEEQADERGGQACKPWLGSCQQGDCHRHARPCTLRPLLKGSGPTCMAREIRDKQHMMQWVPGRRGDGGEKAPKAASAAPRSWTGERMQMQLSSFSSPNSHQEKRPRTIEQSWPQAVGTFVSEQTPVAEFTRLVARTISEAER